MNARAGSPVYFLLHVPKTAGQTIQLHLEEHCAPGVFWIARRRPGLGVAPPPQPDHLKALAGHDLGRSLERHFTGREIRRILLLRDPLELQLSLYNYRMMNHLAKGQGTYPLRLHLKALPRDFVTHHLLSRWLEIPWPSLLAMSDERKYALLNRELARFWFVGTYSDCDRVLGALAADLGVPPAAPPRNTGREWRRQVEWRPLSAAELTHAERALILERHRIDAALWENWRDAGFRPSQVRPRPLAPAWRRPFLADEIRRPAYLATRFLRRRQGKGPGIARADQARDKGDWAAAARHYRKALQHMPGASAVWVQFGHALKESGDPAAAEEAYRESLRRDPDVADTWLQLGHLLKIRGRKDEAVAAYQHALALDPAFTDAARELAALGADSAVTASENRGSR
jgi:hypothetical protein